MRYIGKDDIKTISDIIKYIGDGDDYDCGQLEAMYSTISALKRIVIFTALRSGVTVEELVKLHNESPDYGDMLRSTNPVFPGQKQSDYKDL